MPERNRELLRNPLQAGFVNHCPKVPDRRKLVTINQKIQKWAHVIDDAILKGSGIKIQRPIITKTFRNMSLQTRKIGTSSVSTFGYGAMGISIGYGKAQPDDARLKV